MNNKYLMSEVMNARMGATVCEEDMDTYVWENIPTVDGKLIFKMPSKSIYSVFVTVHALVVDSSTSEDMRKTYRDILVHIMQREPSNVYPSRKDPSPRALIIKSKSDKGRKKLKKIQYRGVTFRVLYTTDLVENGIYSHFIQVFHESSSQALHIEGFESQSPYIVDLLSKLQDIFDTIIENIMWDEDKFNDWSGILPSDEDKKGLLLSMYNMETDMYRKIAIGIALSPYMNKIDYLLELMGECSGYLNPLIMSYVNENYNDIVESLESIL